MVGLLAQRLAVAVVDKDGAAASGFRAVDVPPPIADEKTPFQVDVVAAGGAQEHAGLRLPAIARLAVSRARMVTNFDPIQLRHRSPQLLVHGLNDFARLGSASNVRLITDDNHYKAGRFQLPAPFGDTGIKLELLDARRRQRTSIPHYGPVQYPIAIEEYRAFLYFVLSHFVCAVFSVG